MKFVSSTHLPVAAGLAALFLLGACARTEIVPDDGSQPIGTVTTPPATPMYPAPSAGGGTLYTVQAGDGLYGIAKRYGLSYQDLANWNGIPPPYTIYPGQQLRLSPGGAVSAPVVSAPVLSTPPAPATGGSYHTVQAGETLYSISRRYGRSYQEIAAWNGISAPYTLRVGQRLLVSAGGGYIAPVTPAPVISKPVATPPTTIVEYVDFSQGPEPVVIAPPGGWIGAVYYTVQRGDTLFSVAKRYNQDTQTLAAWNNLQSPYNLNVGQSLLVVRPSSGTLAYRPSVVSQAAATRYTVQRGDTLYSIARRHASTVQELAALNHLPAPYNVNVGQVLRIGGAAAQPKGLRVQSLPGATTQSVGYKRIIHTVQAGETLNGISMRYQQSPHQVAMWNALAPPYLVYAGQQLQIIMP